MPELPDIVVYIEALKEHILGQPLKRVTIASPFLLRTAVPPSVASKAAVLSRCADLVNASLSDWNKIFGWYCI